MLDNQDSRSSPNSFCAATRALRIASQSGERCFAEQEPLTPARLESNFLSVN